RGGAWKPAPADAVPLAVAKLTVTSSPRAPGMLIVNVAVPPAATCTSSIETRGVTRRTLAQEKYVARPAGEPFWTSCIVPLSVSWFGSTTCTDWEPTPVDA